MLVGSVCFMSTRHYSIVVRSWNRMHNFFLILLPKCFRGGSILVWSVIDEHIFEHVSDTR